MSRAVDAKMLLWLLFTDWCAFNFGVQLPGFGVSLYLAMKWEGLTLLWRAECRHKIRENVYHCLNNRSLGFVHYRC